MPRLTTAFALLGLAVCAPAIAQPPSPAPSPAVTTTSDLALDALIEQFLSSDESVASDPSAASDPADRSDRSDPVFFEAVSPDDSLDSLVDAVRRITPLPRP